MHYHGTPITPRRKLLDLAGRHFCVSFARDDDVETCHEIGQSVMLDNGAYSFWRQKREPDWDGYYEWCARWLDYRTTWAVIPDVIDGDEDDNDALITDWPFGTRGSPVWHMHESLERLRQLCDEWPQVCVGSSGQYVEVGDRRWRLRMHEAMTFICDEQGRTPCWLHMLRGLSFIGGVYPFASADSTNIARNHAGSSSRGVQSTREMADRIDAVQCPPCWRPPRSFEVELLLSLHSAL